MATLSPPGSREDLTTRRIRVFTQRYGWEALSLACHAAFPLTLTSDLLYCLRENFLPDCPWYTVADVLLSGLCQPAGYDLYEMEGVTRNRLLRRLCDEWGEGRLKELANFMSQYIENRLQVEGNERPLMFGERPQWTALAYLSPDSEEAIAAIKQQLQQLPAAADAKQRIRWAALVESYADLLAEKGLKPLLLEWAERTIDGEPINDEGTKAAEDIGVALEFFEFDVAVFALEDEQSEELQSFEFETVTVNRRGEIIRQEQRQAYFFMEPLGEGVPALEMVAIRGGTFEMGSPPDEPEHYNDESPQHSVTVPPFFMGKYPVTQAQWRFVAQLPQVNQELKPNPSDFPGDNRPVEQVSWFDAVEFCDRLSQYTGREYRLPTEAEWEYACRAGTTTPFYFGETITTQLANYDGSTYREEPQGENRGETTSVGTFPPNAFGLYDMHGNVWEWCADQWHENYEGAPNDGSAWLDEKENDNHSRLLRGGSWLPYPRVCRSAYRNSSDAVSRYFNYGFRVVCAAART
jgi:formylglycine-generating enzyme required for sulfatase activity